MKFKPRKLIQHLSRFSFSNLLGKKRFSNPCNSSNIILLTRNWKHMLECFANLEILSKRVVFYTGAASGTAPWQQKVAQTVASGIAAGILSGGSAVINHIAESLKAKGVDPSQLKGAGQGIGGNGAGGNNGGGGNAGGNNGGANNGGGKVVYIGGGNNGNNAGGGNGGNSGGGNNGNSGGGKNGGNNAGNSGGGNNGGGNNQGANSGGNGGNNGNNGGSNRGNSGGGNNGGNGKDNGNAGNNGGASKGNAGTSYVFQQAGNTGNAGSANSNGGNGGATSQGGGLSLVQGQANSGAQGNNEGSSGSNKEDLGTTYVFNPIGANGKGGFNTVPTVSGTQRNVRKPANDLLFSSSGGNGNAGNNNQGNTYRFTPINGGMSQGMLYGARGNGQLNIGHFQGNMGHNMHYEHGILTPQHEERPLLNVHEEGHHLRPVAAAENIGSVLNEIVSLLPHEDYSMHAGGDDIHVKPPSMSSSILTNHGHLATVHGGKVPHPATVHGGELPHGSRQNLVNELAEIHATGSTRSKKIKAKEKETMKGEKGSKIVSHKKHGDEDYNVDDDDDDEFDIDKDKEDKDEKEADEVPKNDETEAKKESENDEKEAKEESEREEKEVANGKDLEEVFDELDDRQAAKEHAAQAQAQAAKEAKEAKPEKTKQPPQALTSEAKVSFHGPNVDSDGPKFNSEVSKVGSPGINFVKGTKPGVKFQDFKSSSLGGAITGRQKFLIGNTNKTKGKSWKMKKKSFTEKNKEHPRESKWSPLPVEVKDAWPGTLVSKRSSLRNMDQSYDSKDTATRGPDRSKSTQETNQERTARNSGGTEKRKLIQEQSINGNAKFTLIENKAKVEGRKKIKDPKRPGLIRDYDEDSTPTISSISTKEVEQSDFDVRNEISYDPEINNHEIAGFDGNDETTEIDKRSKISDPSRNKEIKKNEIDFESAIDEDKEKRSHINQPIFMNEGTMKESLVDIPNLGDERGGIVADDLSQKILYRANTVNGSKRDQLPNSMELNDEIIADNQDEQFENGMQKNMKKSDILKSKIGSEVKSHQIIKRNHKRKHKKRHSKLSYRKKHNSFTTGAKRTLFDLRSNKKELANMAVKAFLPLLMNKIHHKLEGPTNHGQQILAYYPYDPKALQTAAATTTISTNRQQAGRPASHSNPLKSGLTFALLSNLFKGQNANQGLQQQQPRVINRLSYPIYFIPPVRQENPPVYSIGPQPAFLPPANLKNPPVASIGPDPPFINSPAPVLPPVASIGPEPFFNPPQPAPKLPEVASIAKDPKPLPPKPGPKLPEVPSIAKEPKPLPTKALPVKPPPTLKKKKGKDKKGKARHITPARATPTQPASTHAVSTSATSTIAEPTRRFMPTQNQEHDPYNTESSMHHEHYHIHHGRYDDLHNLPEHHEDYMHDMHDDHHIHEVHGTQSSIHNTMSVGQGINHEHEHEEHDMHYGMHNDDNDLQGIESDAKMPQGESKSLLSTGRGQNHDLLTKKLSSLLPGFVLVPGHEKGIHDEAADEGGRGDKKGVITGPGVTRSVIAKESLGGAEKYNVAKKRGRKKKQVDKKISTKREMINKEINNKNSRKINQSKEITRNRTEKGEKKSLNVNKITIANAAVKAVMPFLLKNIIQRRKVTKQRKVMYLPMTSGAFQGAAMKAGAAQAIAVPVSSAAAAMLPSAPAIGPDPVAASPEPAKMLPSVASIGPEPDVAPPKPAKALPEVASIGKDPVAPEEKPEKEKKPKVVTDKGKKGKNDKGKDADQKEDKKESKEESKGKDEKKQDKGNEKENKKTDEKGKTRHLAPKMVPLNFLKSSQKQIFDNEQTTDKSSHKSRFVLVPHHEQERADQVKQFMEHYNE